MLNLKQYLLPAAVITVLTLALAGSAYGYASDFDQLGADVLHSVGESLRGSIGVLIIFSFSIVALWEYMHQRQAHILALSAFGIAGIVILSRML